MTREIIAQRIMQCTPRELQQVLDVIHSWEYDFGDENAGRVKTVQEIIDLLARPEYIQEAAELGCHVTYGRYGDRAEIDSTDLRKWKVQPKSEQDQEIWFDCIRVFNSEKAAREYKEIAEYEIGVMFTVIPE